MVGVRLMTDHIVDVFPPMSQQQDQTNQDFPLSVPVTVHGISGIPSRNEKLLISEFDLEALSLSKSFIFLISTTR